MVVQIQDVDRGSTDCGNTDNAHTLNDKMLGPLIAPRMKKAGNLTGLGINSGQVGTLIEIAAMAGKCQVAGIAGAGMLFRDDVLDVMPQFAMDLAQAAVFARLASTAADEIPRDRIHLLLNCGIKLPASL